MTFNTLLKWYLVITRRYSMHAPTQIGMYAAGFLERRDWDHK